MCFQRMVLGQKKGRAASQLQAWPVSIGAGACTSQTAEPAAPRPLAHRRSSPKIGWTNTFGTCKLGWHYGWKRRLRGDVRESSVVGESQTPRDGVPAQRLSLGSSGRAYFTCSIQSITVPCSLVGTAGPQDLSICWEHFDANSTLGDSVSIPSGQWELLCFFAKWTYIACSATPGALPLARAGNDLLGQRTESSRVLCETHRPCARGHGSDLSGCIKAPLPHPFLLHKRVQASHPSGPSSSQLAGLLHIKVS